MRRITMAGRAFGAALLSLLAAGPIAFADTGCQDQVDAAKGLLSEHPEAAAEASLRVKINEAQRLCTANKNDEALDLARQIRDQVGRATAGQGSSAGDTSPIASPTPAPSR